MATYVSITRAMVLLCILVSSAVAEDNPLEYMSKDEREMLKEEARDMFYHAFNAYMDNAYPADELMPLSCKGRYRGSEPDRGDIDSTLGNFSLTLVDTLDTLVVLGDFQEFENAVRLVVKDVTFDTDVIVSLFETNIRMLGGLLSGHILAEYLQLRADMMSWYRGELLDLAKDLGYRFLPAFNTTTGIPFGRINLRHGMKGVPAEMCRETCTACAGSMILEMAALSRLTGESIFEEKAQKAMDALWKMRHRGTDLMGSVLNVHSGDWVRRDSGVGAGIDSYYEYCLKAYILLGDEKYLGRFNKHYQAVMKYVSQGPMLLDVHMHRPNTNSKNFMDALLAFWPGLQVLKGDIKPAVETHEMLYQVMQRHNFIPEAFTTDFQVHWGHHPLRPEFLESTYFLYRATGDHYYLGVGRKVLKSLQTYARVPCGYAAVSDVRTNKHDDTMDSFVLSETFKYLFLLFAEPTDLILDLDEFIFTTEGHLLPLTLATLRTNLTTDLDRDVVHVEELDRTCPNSLHLFPASVRQPLRNMVEDVCPRRTLKRRLNASQFQTNNLEHLKILSNMGITILTLADGRVQLIHTFSNARTAQDAEEGLLFMQEMVELGRKQTQQSKTRPQSVSYVRTDLNPQQEVTMLAGPAHFGPGLKDGKKVTGNVEYANPPEACDELIEPEQLAGKIVMVARGNCMFVEKARRIQAAGAIAGIVLDNVVGSSAAVSAMFAMSGDGKEPDDVTIPVVFLFNKEAKEIVLAQIAVGQLDVTIGDYLPRDEIQLKAPGDLSVFERLKGSLKDFLIRQITPQNSPNANKPAAVKTSMEIESDTSQMKIYAFGQFRAFVFKDKNTVTIVKIGSPPAPTKTLENSLNFEKLWHAFKQGVVYDIYSSSKRSIDIPIDQIKFAYETINNKRGIDTLPVEKYGIRFMIKWFLKELSDVAVDESTDYHKLSSRLINQDLTMLAEMLEFKNSKNANNPAPKEMEISGRSSHLKSFDAIDTVAKNNNAESRQVDKSQAAFSTINEANNRVEDNIKEKSVVDDFWWKKRTEISLTYKAFLQLQISFNAQADKAAKTLISDDDEFETRAESYKDEMMWNVEYNHLKANILKDRDFVKIVTTSLDLVTTKLPKIDNIFERTWYNLRQLLLSLMYSHVEPSGKISATEIQDLYRSVREARGVECKENVSLESMVLWYLKELSVVRPNPRTVGSFVLQRLKTILKSKKEINLEKFEQRFANEFDALGINFSTYVSRLSGAADEEKNNNVATGSNNDFESLILSEILKALTLFPREADSESERSQSVKTDDESTEKSSNVKQVSTLEVPGKTISKSSENPNAAVTETTTKDETLRFLVQIKNEEKSKRDSSGDLGTMSSDSLEDFKKPVWAPDEGKDTAKSFPRFQGKPDLMITRYDDIREQSHEYKNEYTENAKNQATKTSHAGGKRVADEL